MRVPPGYVIARNHHADSPALDRLREQFKSLIEMCRTDRFQSDYALVR